VNNFDPVITISTPTVQLRENVAVGTTVADVDATDNDPPVSQPEVWKRNNKIKKLW
jgi:hypothetical protein